MKAIDATGYRGRTVFLTGATGFLGGQAARRLLAMEGIQLVVLVRGKDRREAEARLARSWWNRPELCAAIGTRIEVAAGDITSPRLGLTGEEYERLAGRITHVIHSAADLRLDGPVEELRRVNVQGAAEVLELARAAHRHHGLQRYAHVSTAYVAGRRTGVVMEDDLGDEHGFSNTYEQTKYEGERLVRASAGDLPLTIFRPGMIVGDSRTGEITTFNTVYVPLRLYLTGRLPVMPCRGNLPVNVVPVDYVADAVSRLTFDARAAGKTFHLTVPPRLLPTARELLEGVKQWAAAALNVHLASPLMVPLSSAALTAIPDAKPFRAIPRVLISYFTEDRAVRDDEHGAPPRSLHPRLEGRPAQPPRVRRGKGLSPRVRPSAPEQALFRMQSRSRPIRFHEIAAGTVRTRTAPEVRTETLRAAASLQAVGVARGDRVAIVGLNSIRYLALDLAMGLIGAVSVPLYATTPAPEMEEILIASGSRFLFIGAPALIPLARMMPVPVISFCRGPLPQESGGDLVAWEDFLALGKAEPVLSGHVALTDPATLRFTSGTTGRPKGAIFRHDQVRWMAETLSSLLPWNARVNRASYLSFLPMNHVVEGILGTYAPYFLPAPVDVWFLDDFRALSQALPRVRPTVFFSVPRFYEKVWESFASRPAGRFYLGLQGTPRNLARPLVRAALLRGSGLDRCAQLISGSAPAAPSLLSAFQELGITIHNAYGLTEAPLATLNPRGANRPGTVGVPLPETQVRIAEDGEVLLKGPQVTRGYDGMDDQPFRDGWLLTGDLGRITEDGSLVLEGRKKDVIVTSYGKNISPGKIEAMLKGIPGIVEAMVVGEGKPFCAALLWGKETFVGSGAAKHFERLDAHVREMNSSLSHPEMIKRWSVLPYTLSIDSGELTGNLKLKRDVISLRLAAVIAAMYDGVPCAGTLHSGSAERETAAERQTA